MKFRKNKVTAIIGPSGCGKTACKIAEKVHYMVTGGHKEIT